MEYIRKDNTKIEFITILENPKKATTFKHFKGKLYKILTVAKDCETLEEMVIYQGQYDNYPCWIRKKEDFFSKVDKVKYPNIDQEYRFQKLDSDSGDDNE